MKIITVNIPNGYLRMIAKLVGDKALYSSRSELCRIAVREYLIKELKQLKSTTGYENLEETDEFEANKIDSIELLDDAYTNSDKKEKILIDKTI